MENASQALFMAAGVLIAVLIISFGVYTFRTSSSIGENYDSSRAQLELQAFNSKYSVYDKTHYYAKRNSSNELEKIEESAVEDESDALCVNYNTIFDVVSAINQAYDNNYKKQYDYKKSIMVCVNFDIDAIGGGKYGIHPLIQKDKGNSDKNIIYKFRNIPDEKNNDKDYVDINSTANLNKLIEDYSDCNYKDDTKIYKYVFDGETKLNSETGLIDYIKFTININKTYKNAP